MVTVMSNLGLTLMAQEKGIKLEKTKVGDRYVLENMMEKGRQNANGKENYVWN